MKFTLSWLKDHLDTEATLDEIADALTDLGLEVEGIENPAATLATFTVGKVLDAEKHPDADRLRVCKVETDEGEKQIVCGAPNARAGIKVVVAKPGDYVPGIDTTIKVGKIRGVESHGMMASEREMELSDDHDGIIELPADAEVGTRCIDLNRPRPGDRDRHHPQPPRRARRAPASPAISPPAASDGSSRRPSSRSPASSPARSRSTSHRTSPPKPARSSWAG